MIESVDQLPAALRPREFKVGDRVRVVLSGECRFEDRDGFNGHGHLGQVVEILDAPWLAGHDLVVDMDNGSRGWFAPAELEPLGDES